MIAIAMMNNKPKEVLDYEQFMEMMQRDYQLDVQDVVSLIKDGIEHYHRHPELETIFDAIQETRSNTQDGIWGDAFYEVDRELREACEDIRQEIDALNSTARKGNTKADIALRLRNIVSNLENIL